MSEVDISIVFMIIDIIKDWYCDCDLKYILSEIQQYHRVIKRSDIHVVKCINDGTKHIISIRSVI